MVKTRPDSAARSRLSVALLWSYTLSVGRFGVGGALTFLLAAILDPRSFGVMFMATVWMGFILMLIHHATLPVVQQPDLEDRHFSAALWAMLMFAVVACGLMFASAPALAALNQTPELADVIRALAPILLVEAASAIPNSVLRRQMRFRVLAVRGLVSTVVGGAVGISMAFMGFGVWALVGQQWAACLTTAVVLWAVRPWRVRFGPMRAEVRDMRATALKSVGGFFGYFVALRTDALLMGVMFGPVAVGLYRLATKLTEMVRDLASSALSDVSLPDLAALHRDPDAFVKRLSVFVHTSAVVAFPLLGLVAGTAEPVIAVIGPEWSAAVGPLRVLCLASAIWVVYSLLTTALMAAQRTGTEALFNWLRGAVAVGAILVASAATSDTASTSARIMAIAFAVLAMEIILILVLWYVTFARVLHTSSAVVLLVMAPAAAISVITAGVAWGVLRVLPQGMTPILALMPAAVAAVLVGGSLLALVDPRVAGQLKTVRQRLRKKRAGQDTPTEQQAELVDARAGANG